MPDSPVLMLNIEGRHIPYAYRVSEPAFKYFKDLHDPNMVKTPQNWRIVKKIEKWEELKRLGLIGQIQRWQDKTRKELEEFDLQENLHETAKTNAKDIFDP
jgi:hypothetical protein